MGFSQLVFSQTNSDGFETAPLISNKRKKTVVTPEPAAQPVVETVVTPEPAAQPVVETVVTPQPAVKPAVEAVPAQFPAAVPAPAPVVKEVVEETAEDSEVGFQEDNSADELHKDIRSQIKYSDDKDLKGIDITDDTPLDPDMFVSRAKGTSLHNYSLAGGVQFGKYNHIFNWHLALSIILWKGEAEINFPISYYKSELDLEEGFTNPDHSHFTTAIKYRKWHSNEDLGFFYGAGLRMIYWSLKYDRLFANGSTITKELDPFIVFVPQLEFGHQWAMSRDFYVRSSAEIGYALSAYNSYKQADDITDIEYQNSTVYWNLLVSLVYAF